MTAQAPSTPTVAAPAFGEASVAPRLVPASFAVLDLLLIAVVIGAAARLREALPFDRSAADVSDLALQLSPVIMVAWLVMLVLLGTYRPHQLDTGLEHYRNIVTASVLAAGLVGIWCYLGRIPLSRGFFVMSFVIGMPVLVLGRVFLRRVLHRLRAHGYLQHRVIIAGDPVHVDDLARVLRREPWLGYQIIGALAPERGLPSDGEIRATPDGIPYLGSATFAPDLAVAGHADSFIVTWGAYSSAASMRRAQWDLEEHRVQVIVVPDVTDIAAERVAVRPVAGLPLVHLERPARQRALRGAKRTFDLTAAAALLIVLSPLMLFAAWRVRRYDGGPILFQQLRIGREGDSFPMLKFRSMVVDAEARLAELGRGRTPDEQPDKGNTVMFKMSGDPRITTPGRWLRRYSVDELPQLFNVLRGEMSLVGPRPALPSEVEKYEPDAARRLRVRPGLTGLWQVSGRSDLSWEDTVRLDLYYVDNWSMVQDLLILLRTIRAVTRSSGAY